jgi:hypothetical protein
MERDKVGSLKPETLIKPKLKRHRRKILIDQPSDFPEDMLKGLPASVTFVGEQTEDSLLGSQDITGDKADSDVIRVG